MGELPVVPYSMPDGRVIVNALVKDETLWMTQAGMAGLSGVTPQSITYHLKTSTNRANWTRRQLVKKFL